ncbi:MAG: bifunctional diaminohydroxyphosphoribosylaminopyrimidine deaminase/5-amino-6-(5-phosphoribosylamino)uracil reductase RibD [Sedimentisphaerales bacterium]|nr:bifunctional diaminohydroxyphosphoribosylaminopyrimidine deaminase/5-amino-6-(5-phosphoribosylamino)uracil reductase RibD [Sedimentisphaerales bacterium]
MTDPDIKHMKMALKLAERGLDSVEPNPAVGCIIAKANQIIGRGWHKKFGGPHAEINAMEDCKSLGVNPKDATMYVTLEPCSHFGKTKPCAEAVIAAGLGRVVIATVDPSEHSNGRGIDQLRAAGITVETGLCQTEARLLNAPFIKFAATRQPWVTLKWAQSLDGKLAWTLAAGQSSPRSTGSGEANRWISNKESRRDVQRLRRRAGAILVGVNTLLADDPFLVPRPPKGKKPLRIVLDSYLRTKLTSRLLRTTKTSPVMIFTRQDTIMEKPDIADRIIKKGAELVGYPDTHGLSNLHYLLDDLRDRGIGTVLVEGGPTVIASFLKERLADEICIYLAPKILAQKGGADLAGPIAQLSQATGLHYVRTMQFGDDICITGLTEEGLRGISVGERVEQGK